MSQTIEYLTVLSSNFFVFIFYLQISCECVQEQLHHQGRDSQSPPRNASRDSESPPSQFSQRSVSGALQQTRDILSSTNKATRSMLSHVSDKSWWKKTLTSINSRRQVRLIWHLWLSKGLLAMTT